MVLMIVGIGIIGVFLLVLFKELKPSIAMLVSLATCILLLIVVLNSFTNIISKLKTYLATINVSSELFYYLFKIVGIGYLIEFVVDIAEECGGAAIASKLALAGKVIIAGISLPMLFELLDMILGLV